MNWHIALKMLAWIMWICITWSILKNLSNIFLTRKRKNRIRDKFRHSKTWIWLKKYYKKNLKRRYPHCHDCIFYKEEEVRRRDRYNGIAIFECCTNKKIPLQSRQAGLKHLRNMGSKKLFYYIAYPIFKFNEYKYLCGKKGKYFKPVEDFDKEYLL